MNDYQQKIKALKADIAQAQADMDGAAKAVRRERNIINALLGASVTLAAVMIIMAILSLATDQQQQILMFGAASLFGAHYAYTIGSRRRLAKELAEVTRILREAAERSHR